MEIIFIISLIKKKKKTAIFRKYPFKEIIQTLF